MNKSLVFSFLSLSLLTSSAIASPGFDRVLAGIVEQKNGTASHQAVAVFPDKDGVPASKAVPSIPLLINNSELSLADVTDALSALRKANGTSSAKPFTDKTYIGYRGLDIIFHLLFYLDQNKFVVMANKKSDEVREEHEQYDYIQLPTHPELSFAVQTQGDKHRVSINGVAADYSFHINSHGLPFIETFGPQSVVRLLFNGQTAEQEKKMWFLIQEIYHQHSKD